jgi:hypothetical protein
LPRRRDRDRDDLSIFRTPKQSTGLSLTAMILGIAGLVVTLASIVVGAFMGAMCAAALCPCGAFSGYAGFAISGIAGVLGMVFGFIGLGKGGKGFAMTGIITGGVNLLLILAYVAITLILGAGFLALVGAAAGPPPPPR